MGIATRKPGLEVIKREYSLKLKIKRNDWLLADTCPQAANHCALLAHLSRSDKVSFCDQSSSVVVRLPLTIDLNDKSS